VTGLEILDQVLLGQTTFHRCDDAWDLLDENGLVAAVLCPRKQHLSVAPVAQRVPPAPVGRLMPYGEKVELKITADGVEEGVDAVRRLAAAQDI
jgi:hypothetical protein